MKKLLIILSASALAVAASAATTCYYVGGTGNWEDEGNWQDGVMPAAADTAVISNTVAGTEITVGEAVTVANLTFSGTAQVVLKGATVTLAANGILLTDCPTEIDNDIAFAGKGHIRAGTGYSTKPAKAHLVCNGAISCAGDWLYIGGGAGADFNGSVTAEAARLSPVYGVTAYNGKNGVFNFNAPVRVKTVNTENSWAYPYFCFNSTGNAWTTYSDCYADVTCGVANALCATGVITFNNYWNSTICSFCLNGDQIIDRINSPEPLYGTAKKWYNGHRFHSTVPVTLTMRGSADARTFASINDAISLVWAPTGNSTMTFSNRIHTTTGTITVSNGTFRVAGETTFANVPEITVCENAAFELDVTAGAALGGVTNLSIGADGKFLTTDATANPFSVGALNVTMAEGAELRVFGDITLMTLKIGETQYDAQDYPAGTIPGLTGDGKVTVLSSGWDYNPTGRWIGEGASGKMSVAANWEGGRPGLMDLTFALGGSRAVLDADFSAVNLLFDTDSSIPSFAIDADESAAGKELGVSTSITVNDRADGVARDYAIGAPVAPLSDALAITVNGGANTLTLDGAFASSVPSVTLTRTGLGTLYLNATNSTLVGPATFSSGTNYITGGALGADPNNLVIFNQTAGTGRAVMQGGVHDRNYRFARNTATPLTVLFPAVSTNRFNGAVIWKTNYGISTTVSSGSSTVFAGGVGLTDIYDYVLDFQLFLGAEMMVTNEPLKATCDGYCDWPPIHFSGYAYASGADGYTSDPVVTLAATNCESVHGIGVTGRARLKFDVDYAFGRDTAKVTPLYMMLNAGDLNAYGGRVDLNGHDQLLGSLMSRPAKQSKKAHAVNAACWIGSETPATLRVYQNIATNADDVGWKPPFTGAISLRKEGPEVLPIGGYSSTTGRLEVAEGVLWFCNNVSGWTNATEYVVSGGELKIHRAGCVRRKADWRLAAAGKLDIAEGVEIVAKHLWLTDGQGVTHAAPAGVYTRANAPEYITGEGSVRCTGGGTVIILR